MTICISVVTSYEIVYGNKYGIEIIFTILNNKIYSKRTMSRVDLIFWHKMTFKFVLQYKIVQEFI